MAATSTATPIRFGSTEEGVDRCAFVTFQLRPDERVYGLGESFGRVEKTGLEQRLWVAEAFTNNSPVVYKPVPFCLSTRGYGIYVNSSHAMQTHIGDLDPTALSWIVEDTDVLDFFIVLGPGLPDVLRRYTDLTGTPAVPPRWSFGLWLSRCTYTSQDEVLAVAQEAREHDIPADVMHIDTGWFEHDWVCDWRFGSRFPDPAAMVAELRELGFRVTLWQWPYVGVDSPAFAEARDAGVLVRRRGGGVLVLPGRNGPDVGVIDYSDPAAARWLQVPLAAAPGDGCRRDQGGFRRSCSGRWCLRRHPLGGSPQRLSPPLQPSRLGGIRGHTRIGGHGHLGALGMGRLAALSAALVRRWPRSP